LIKSNTNHK